ncbi:MULTISPECIES: hypothetical protein [unclassified Pseudomonas]|uniref:DUF7079 family protein n=1 Tax=unclassified Pseudomonas TaxID=196821 RepID=UPI0009DB521A|nr:MULTISPECIES: hypothetical protein [unclassified Pseudomonas]MBD9515073.1 hypothetical protein [Pseudomonas sp. PDM22]MBD9685928.1 hypothetical protein [Pseudomonas sp. PDM20]OQR32274.1 hypothetical protein BWR15_20450 [Pseudomonas sp. T]
MNDPARESVWLALSELWLDTEPSETDINYIARTLAVSDFPLGELEAIYRLEVVPVVYPNALATAGEWTGFDPDWLFEKCRRNQQRRAFFLYRWRCRLLSRTVGALMNAPLQQVLARVVELRELTEDKTS